MAPIRRYLRITKFSVLECRIYLDNPTLAQSWLLHPRDPVLPRIIDSIRQLVIPKLREERERAKKKSTKKKSIKDVVIQDDFEVSIFLTERNTRHALLRKHKHFRDKAPERLRSNSNKLMGESSQAPVEVDDDDDDDDTTAPILRERDSEDDDIDLAKIPVARPKRRRGTTVDDDGGDEDDAAVEEDVVEVLSGAEEPAPKRPRRGGDDQDDKKKLALDVTYEGFDIYGRVLCLVVKKRSQQAASEARGVKPGGQGQARMENWISSTQVPVGEDMPVPVSRAKGEGSKGPFTILAGQRWMDAKGLPTTITRLEPKPVVRFSVTNGSR
ncbi:hypothetical protein CDD80_5889 [Ophiocordyceps camponoti-rufipedis]|uniref:Uncharacterized protein n=1 Tax=Ophiocordyceps camponoti-rufipedis TaxID=2004952 RepID=A0A2C5YSV8_9HYPO|nr:hypothetical protein CDD80_5889 [Ophiocordyceps camponoti-rufipedis]